MTAKNEVPSMTDFAGQSLDTLKAYRDELGKKYGEAGRAINARRKYLKTTSGKGVSIKDDPELKELQAKSIVLQNELTRLKEYMTANKDDLEAEDLRVKEEIAAYEVERAKLIETLRPASPRIWFGSEFKKCTDSERRLVSMMAREIGLRRYQELRMIAFYDEKHKNNKYYTGSDAYNHGNGVIVE